MAQHNVKLVWNDANNGLAETVISRTYTQNADPGSFTEVAVVSPGINEYTDNTHADPNNPKVTYKAVARIGQVVSTPVQVAVQVVDTNPVSGLTATVIS